MLLFIYILALITPSLCTWDYVIKNTEQGKIKGISDTDRKGNTYYSFLGIPYAKPPIGKLRFQPPEEPEKWVGDRDSKVPPACTQWLLHQKTGEEDCLYLNVHTPKECRCGPQPKPVLFYIHGGSLLEGTGNNYGAKFLMPECVVLVTINYRLGLFGFLNSDNEKLGIPGNNGLKDQVMALKWVQRNIKNFGGDPNNVMIVGESAGGVSVHMHMMSKMSKELFHKAVAMSGHGELAWAHGMSNNVGLLGIDASKDPEEVWMKLRGLDKNEILEFQKDFPLIMPLHRPFEAGPVIEPQRPESFLTDRPLNLIKSGNYNKVPFMLGYTNIDGLIGEIMTRRDFGKPFIITDFEKMVPQHFNHTGLDVQKVAAEIGSFYFGNEVPSTKNLPKMVDMATGGWFISGTPHTVEAHARAQCQPVYLYRFSADTEINVVKKAYPDTALYKGATHVEDLAYLFNNEFTPKIQPGSPEDIAVDTTVKLFTNFMKYNNPRKDWFPVTPGVHNYMDIGITAVPGVTPDQKAYEFWDKLYKKYL